MTWTLIKRAPAPASDVCVLPTWLGRKRHAIRIGSVIACDTCGQYWRWTYLFRTSCEFKAWVRITRGDLLHLAAQLVDDELVQEVDP